MPAEPVDAVERGRIIRRTAAQNARTGCDEGAPGPFQTGAKREDRSGIENAGQARQMTAVPAKGPTPFVLRATTYYTTSRWLRRRVRVFR